MNSPSGWTARLRRPAAQLLAESGVVYIVCATLLLRWPSGGRLWHQLWAEDGAVFIRCQVDFGLSSCMSTPYTGYLQFWPRLLTSLVVVVPPSRWALAAALLAVAVAALSITVVYRASAWLVPSRLVRLFGVAVICASGAAHWAPDGNLANLHWFLFVSGFFLAADRCSSDSWWWTAVRASWLASVCLSEALGPVVLGAYLVGMLLRRYQRGRWRLSDAAGGVVVAVAVGLQLYEYVRNPRRPAPPGGGETVRRALAQYPEQVLHLGWMGPTSTGQQVGRAAIIAALVLLAGGLVVTAIGASRRTLQTQWIMPLSGGVVLALASIGSWEANVVVNDAIGARYIFVPFCFIVMSTLTVLTGLYGLSGVRWPLAVPAVAGLAAALTLLVVTPYRPLVATNTPTWHSQLAVARQRCAVEAPDAIVNVRIAPSKKWVLTTQCRLIFR